MILDSVSHSDILLSAQRALLYNIFSGVKHVSVELDKENHMLLLEVGLDKEPSDRVKSIFYSVAGEMCGDFPGLNNSVVSFSTLELDHVEKKLEHLVFCRMDNPPT